MGPLRPALASLLATGFLFFSSCSEARDAAAQATWTRVQLGPDDEKLEQARLLAGEMTPLVAQQVLDARGSFAGEATEPWLLAGVARLREDGVAWLARQAYGDTLDAAFGDVLDGTELYAEPEPQWHQLPDILLDLFDGDPLADRWLALIAVGERGSYAQTLYERLEADPSLRLRLLAGLDQLDPEKPLPFSVFMALGRPSNSTEAVWLERRYRQLFAAALDNGDIDDQSMLVAATEAFERAFGDAPLPIAREDRAVVESLPELLSGQEEPPEDAPSFDDVARFMTRHRRTNWLAVLQVYASWRQLPSNALSYVCRASAGECADVLREDLVREIAAAADVAPALDLEGGDATMTTACDQLAPDQARQLASRATASGRSLAVRESGVACLAVLGDEVTPLWRSLLRDAVETDDWKLAELVAAIDPELVDARTRQAALAAVRAGKAPALDLAELLQGSEEGRTELIDAVLAADPNALAPDARGRAPSLLGAAARARRPRLGGCATVEVRQIVVD